jgi:putative SOS response-associated peptidase YedK
VGAQQEAGRHQLPIITMSAGEPMAKLHDRQPG